MAEVAAGAGLAIAAEEVLSTTLQVGAATYFLTTPTQPLNAIFTRIAVAYDDDLHKLSLCRSNHTLTIVDNKAYIFGGETADGEIASNDVHVVNLAAGKNQEPEYQLVPAIAGEEGKVPKGRTGHSACAYDGGVIIYGGTCTKGREPADEGDVWMFHPEKKTWSCLYSPSSTPMLANKPVLTPETQSRIFSASSNVILLTGTSSTMSTLHRLLPDDPVTKLTPFEIRLPNAITASPSNAALHDNTLYIISTSDPVSSQLHILPLDTKEGEQDPKWTTLTFPTNPLIPGPRARHAGALLPISTGYGRNYLIYLLGARSSQASSGQDAASPQEKEQVDAEAPTQWSDTWALQLPASNLAPQPSLTLADAIKPAKLKDAIRAGVGADTGKWSWAEVRVRVPDDLGEASAGKLHPGPRAAFGADVGADGKSVVFWGGVDAEGGRVGDGWVVGLE